MSKSEYQGARVLVVEDEESLAIGLEYNLSEEGYLVERSSDGKDALKKMNSAAFDLVILDIMLPYMDGFEVARKVRRTHPRLPILMLTAKTRAKDRVQGLEVGADDYLTKPFHLEELLLRVKGMLRRKTWYNTSSEETPLLLFGENEVNFETLSGKTKSGEMRLTIHEAMLLKYLAESPGKVVSRKELLQKVWNINPEVETRTVDNFIARLRKYFEADPENPQYIKSVRGVGYLFEYPE